MHVYLLHDTHTHVQQHSNLGEEEMVKLPVSAPVLEAIYCIGQFGTTTVEISSGHVDNKISIWHSSPILSIC